jgi:ferredoxin--NADP+ reductase/benzoate/toluate 1,2-dioxygenase reductase subunit
MSEEYYHNIHKVEKITNLTDSTFILQIERKGLKFTPGQHLVLGKKDDGEFRQYSLYNGMDDPFFQILVKEVEDGILSPKLKRLSVGDEVEINGPMGYFTISEQRQKDHPIVFIATGTGIAPFKSMIKSFPNLNYELIHGVKSMTESYENNTYPTDKLTVCTSQDKAGDFHGRVTEYLKTQNFDKETLFYLCGNSEMIFDAMEILKDQGMNPNNMFAEVYF